MGGVSERVQTADRGAVSSEVGLSELSRVPCHLAVDRNAVDRNAIDLIAGREVHPDSGAKNL